MSGIIIQVRGTHGSGKTTAVKSFIDNFPHTALTDADGKIIAMAVKVTGVDRPVYIMGKYDNACGGMDGINTQEEAALRVINAWKTGQGHVICEGVLSSGVSPAGTFPRMLIENIPNDRLKFRTLDTPLDKCIDRVNARRAARGKDGEFDPRNVINKYGSVVASYPKYVDAGFDMKMLDHTKAYEQLLALLMEHAND